MKKPKARERILDTAAQLFQERGYSEVGINEIIDKAETAKATFYQHFPSKQSLCAEWLEEVHQRSESRRQAIMAGEGSAIEKVEVAVNGMWSPATLDPPTGKYAWRGWQFQWNAAPGGSTRPPNG